MRHIHLYSVKDNNISQLVLILTANTGKAGQRACTPWILLLLMTTNIESSSPNQRNKTNPIINPFTHRDHLLYDSKDEIAWP